MAKFVEFDPLRGLATYEDNYNGHLQVHYRQDVEPVLDLANIERSGGHADRQAKKGKWGEEVHLYARLPPVIIMEMRFKHGVDIFKKDHLKKAFELINREYPKFKVTEKTHRMGRESQVFT